MCMKPRDSLESPPREPFRLDFQRFSMIFGLSRPNSERNPALLAVPWPENQQKTTKKKGTVAGMAWRIGSMGFPVLSKPFKVFNTLTEHLELA